MRRGHVGIALVVFGLGACGGSSRSERAGEAGGSGSTTKITAFQLIDPVARHIEEAQNTGATLNTYVDFVSGDLTFAIGWSRLSRNGAEVPDDEPIRWSVAEGTMPLGALPGMDPATDETQIWDVDATGSVVVGRARSATTATRAFRWTRETGMVDISPEGSAEAHATLVSDDGSVVAGWFSGIENQELRVFRWTSATGAVDLGAIPGVIQGEPAFLSPDGSVIAGIASPACLQDGSCQESALFQWSEEAGMENLGALPGHDYCFATYPTAVTYGPLLTGFCVGDGGQEPFLWSEADGLRGLGTLPAGGEGGPTAVSEDGRVAIFQGRSASGTAVMWRWTANSGVSEIAPSSGYTGLQVSGFRWGMSADGSVSIGTLQTAPHGTRAARLTAQGLEVLAVPDGHEISSPSGVSRAGRTIAGSASTSTGGNAAVVWRGDGVVVVADALVAGGVELPADATLIYASPFPNDVLVGGARTPTGTLAWIATLSD